MKTVGLVQITCSVCGSTKSMKPWEAKRRSGLFCSLQCEAVSRRRPLAERFWKCVDRRMPDECWNWTGKLTKKGYGRISCTTPNHPRMAKVHRLSWEWANNASLLPDALIMHSCDNPCCVNPQHLSLGTVQENTADAARKGKLRRGEASHLSTLTEAKVKEIRAGWRSAFWVPSNGASARAIRTQDQN